MTRKFERSRDFVEGDCESGHAIPSDKPIFIDERQLFPGSNLHGAIVQDNRDGWSVLLEIEGPLAIGLFARMTPDGARMCGQMLIKMAAEVDELIAQQAAAAIRKARKP